MFQIDTSIFNNNLQFVIELIKVFHDNKLVYRFSSATTDQFEKSKNLKMEQVCPDLDASAS